MKIFYKTFVSKYIGLFKWLSFSTYIYNIIIIF